MWATTDWNRNHAIHVYIIRKDTPSQECWHWFNAWYIKTDDDDVARMPGSIQYRESKEYGIIENNQDDRPQYVEI